MKKEAPIIGHKQRRTASTTTSSFTKYALTNFVNTEIRSSVWLMVDDALWVRSHRIIKEKLKKIIPLLKVEIVSRIH